MRKILKISIMLTVCCIFLCACQKELFEDAEENLSLSTKAGSDVIIDYYWFNGEKIPITRDNDLTYILYNDQSRDEVFQKLKEKGVNLDDIEEHLSVFNGLSTSKNSDGEDISAGNFWTCVPVGVNDAAEIEGLTYYAPCYIENTKRSFPLSEYVYVSLKSGGEVRLLEEMAGSLGVTIKGEYRSIPGLYILECGSGSEGNALDIANKLAESGTFNFSEPAFICGTPFTNDPLFSQQWNLHDTNTPAYDIKYNQSINLLPSSSSIIVGVVDSGIELTHTDLNIHSFSWDAVTVSSPSQIWYSNGSSPSDIDSMSHGTNMAGVISGISNNSMGIAGIASPVKSMSLSVQFLSPSFVADAAAAIAKAVDKGASVINCSWGSVTYSAIIQNAISYATTNGRDGKGCVVVCASGNANREFPYYPATYTPESGVISVGAIQTDGHRWVSPLWGEGSNYGGNLDIVAPGVGVPSTSLNNTYSTDNMGTSIATAQVSAVAALILTINPSLTYEEVEYIITRSANKSLPGYTFSNGGYKGTWNSEVGRGLLDMYSALTMAQATTAYSSLSVGGSGSMPSTGYFSGSANLVADSSGYAWANMSVGPSNLSYTYLWDGVFTGECDSWYIWPSNSGHGSSADVSIYLNPGDTGGRLEARCFVFNGTTFIGKATAYLYVSPGV